MANFEARAACMELLTDEGITWSVTLVDALVSLLESLQEGGKDYG